MDAQGNMVDLSLAPNAEVRNAGGDFNVTSGWGSNSVTYSFSNLLDGGLPLASGTTTADLRQMIYDALGLWTAVSGLTLTYQNDPGGAINDNTYNGSGFPQIRIGHHDIPDNNPPLNTLAHCYFPGGNGRDGDMHFDDTDTWGNGTGGGINFLETATHELGHGIGILHANGDAVGSCPAAKPAIMDACIQNRFTDRNSAYLFADDIAAAQSLYGNSLGYIRGQDGVARVYGTGVASNVSGANVITVSTANIFLIGDCYVVNSSGYGQTIIPTNTINGLIIEGMGGDDILRVDSNFAGKPITLRGGNGNDYFDFGYNVGSLNGLPQGVTVEGGAGTDYIWTYDDNTAVAQTYTVTNARFDRGGWGGFYYDVDLESLYLRTGTGADVVNVQSTWTGQPVVIASAGGADTVNLGNASNGIRSLNADVQIQNDPSFTNININNGPDTGARNWAVDISGGFGYLTGMAPANIFWDNTDINAIGLTCGSGVDVGQINRLSETLSINNTNGDNVDHITVGNAGAGGLQSITQGRAGGLTIDNNPDYTNLVFDDTGDGVARTATLDLVSSYNQLTGLAPAVIRFDPIDIRDVTIIAGAANDALNLLRYNSAGVLTINSSGSSSDTINIGNTTDGVRSIFSSVVVRNSPAFSTVNVNSNFDAVARTITVDYDSVSDLQSIYGIAPAPISWDPGDISSSGGVNIVTGSGRDTVSVLANERTLNLSTPGSSGEEVVIGPDLDRINDAVFVRNPPSFTAVTLNDTAFSGGRQLEIGNAPIGAETFTAVYGFGSVIYLKATDIAAPAVLNAGNGADNITILSPLNSFVVNGGGGHDTVNLGSPFAGLRSMDPLNASLTVNGGTGDDLLFLNDQDYGAGGSITVGPSLISTNHSAIIAHSDFAILDVNLSNAGEILTVTDTLPTFLVQAHGGVAHDVIDVHRTASSVYIASSAGLDDISADTNDNGSPALVLLSDTSYNLGVVRIGDGGYVNLAGITEATARVTQLNLAGGRLDLNNSTLLVNYSGASPIASVRNGLLAGRNGGAWNGSSGILSSTVLSQPNFTIGYAEASQVRTSFPATFGSFTDVDNTTVVVRYTLKGDANLDRSVNFDDLLRVAQNYDAAVSGRVWSQGDFDYTGIVNFDDLLMMAQQYGGAFATDWARLTTRAGRSVLSTRVSAAESLEI